MIQQIDTYLLPSLLNSSSETFLQSTAVVIDILRASSTMVTALGQGATSIYPCLEVEEALQIKAGLTDALVGGERGGKPIDGFDCSNSPADYSAERVRDRPVVFTTTNGTRALSHVSDCQEVLIGSFLNLSALCDQLQTRSHILLLCAGTNGMVTREDVLFAGAVADRLRATHPESVGNDQTALARAAWKQVEGMAGDVKLNLAESFKETLGGRNLLKLGYGDDFSRVADIDRYDIVPDWRREQGLIKVP